MSESVEVICRKCGQVNRRVVPTTRFDRVMHADDDDVCFACGTPCDGGEAQLDHRVDGAMGHFWYFTAMPIFFGGVGAVCALIVFSPLRLFVPGNSFVLEALNWVGAGAARSMGSTRRGGPIAAAR